MYIYIYMNTCIHTIPLEEQRHLSNINHISPLKLPVNLQFQITTPHNIGAKFRKRKNAGLDGASPEHKQRLSLYNFVIPTSFPLAASLHVAGIRSLGCITCMFCPPT